MKISSYEHFQGQQGNAGHRSRDFLLLFQSQGDRPCQAGSSHKVGKHWPHSANVSWLSCVRPLAWNFGVSLQEGQWFFSRKHISPRGFLSGSGWQEWTRRTAGKTSIISCWHPSRTASGATWDNLAPVGFWCLFCFALAFLPQLLLTPSTHSPHTSGSRGVRSHLCTLLHCTVGASSLILNTVWSALTQHTTHSLLHHGKTHQSGWLRDVSWPTLTGRNRLKQLLLGRRLSVMFASNNIDPPPAQKSEEDMCHKLITQNMVRVFAHKLQNLSRKH